MCIAVHTVNKNTKRNKNSQSVGFLHTLAVFIYLYDSDFFFLRKKKAIATAIEEIPPVANSGSTMELSPVLAASKLVLVCVFSSVSVLFISPLCPGVCGCSGSVGGTIASYFSYCAVTTVSPVILSNATSQPVKR